MYTECALKTDPSDYAVYTVFARVYLYKQCSILIVVSFYTRRNPLWWRWLNFGQKYYSIIGPQKHILTQWQNTLVMTRLCPRHLHELRDIAVKFIISLWLLLDPVLLSWLHINLHRLPVILFWSSSLWSFCTSLPFIRVCLLHLALIFNSPLLDWKLFTNRFCTSSLTLTNKCARHFRCTAGYT